MYLKRPSILIDVDDVIVDNSFLSIINEFLGTRYTEDNLSKYYFDDEIIPKERFSEYHDYLLAHDMYENCKLVKGAKENIEILSKDMDVFFCSSCILKGMERDSGIFFKRKFDFLIRTFPEIDPRRIILSAEKNMFKGFDYQVDDLISNLKNDSKYKLLFTRYHNKNISSKVLENFGVSRVNDWDEIYDYIMGI